jgi:hypothetical protein
MDIYPVIHIKDVKTAIEQSELALDAARMAYI